jgi:hypothetical protein
MARATFVAGRCLSKPVFRGPNYRRSNPTSGPANHGQPGGQTRYKLPQTGARGVRNRAPLLFNRAQPGCNQA